MKTPIFFIFLFLLPLNIAKANEINRFIEPETLKEKRIIKYAQDEHFQTPDLLLAKIDLNDDLRDEYIVKSISCIKNQLCQNVIIALMDGTPITIGEFDAHKIILSGKKNYGVRQITIYNQINNDFASETLAWNPYQYKMVIKSE